MYLQENWVHGYPGMSNHVLSNNHPPARRLLYSAGMSKSSKRGRRSRSTADRSAIDVVTQLEVAFRNPHAALIGALIGGLVPWFGRTLAHAEIPATWSAGQHALAVAMLMVVLGCGLFSGLSVYKFGRAAFGDPRKALGFVLALEGVMLVSHGATSTVALVALILINAVANGSVIALARDATCRKRAADARAAATRARSRSRTAETPPRSTRNDAPTTHHVPVVVVTEAPSKARTINLGLVKVPARWRPACDAIETEVLA